MFGNNSGLFSSQPRGFPQVDPPSQRSSLSRPNARSIYMQRKEYSETINKQPDSFQYRVEHLFTCELDGQEVRSLDDCVARLQRLQAKGRVWGQEMILEVQGGYLQLNDIETKTELESVPLGSVVQTKAVLDTCAYNSLLTVMVQERNRRIAQVFMFQCEEVRAEHIREDLDKAVQHNANAPPPEPRREPSRHQSNPPPPMMLQERTPPPPDRPALLYNDRNSRENESFPLPPVFSPPQQPLYGQEMYGGSQQYGARDQEPPHPQYTDTQRSVDILNHVLNDLELFIEKVSAAVPNEDKNKDKKKKKKISKQNAVNLPHWEEFVACLQKIKYGFNLLGKLNGEIQNPSAADFVHILFSTLGMLMSHYPPDLPPSVLTPLLTEPALILLSLVVTPEEDKQWRALGDAWNIPRSNWPDSHMLPSYNPEFYDGWLPPKPVPPAANQGLRSSNSQHIPPREEMMQQMPDEPMMNSPPPSRPSELAPDRMCVIYDFMARNPQELSILKGEVVQVVDKSGQWWRVRNERGEEGHVAKNVLEPLDGGEPWGEGQKMRSPPPLNMQSRPADVKAWLEYKAFSKITVRSLSVLNGALLLGMTRDDMKTVCPEEGGRVFFQLQAIKSSIALASESNGYGPYNGR
ncbi:epidermal growth factor receptor kinase substrate 8-like protein 3 [Coregonus clupeaformis]|uniref:epidermal growth factor receptor kinase substrate 8-like protein 3 n=1 Tax=Coregonus clupeaformis TaxID=59861 RepID=UPI001E1C8B89|nr:epidermal growth factor receptor kinase substrate 8-like protein 3 [Coregonus clupeaformis]XP_041701268.2 epidermal growth factor receptor kinase substrate 8-like protein 3 [Coregonus clupeaformis]